LAADAPLDLTLSYDDGGLSQAMRGLSLLVDYDPAAFDYVGVQDEGWLSGFGNAFFSAQLVAPGQIRIDASLLGLTGGASGSGTLATVHLSTRADAVEGPSLIGLSASSIVDLANPPAQLPRVTSGCAVNVDRTPPPVLAGLTAGPLGSTTTLSWDPPASDYVGARVFWKAWDATVPHGYPEYDDLIPAPAWPTDLTTALAQWNEVTTAATSAGIDHGARTVISALVIPVDAAGNLGDFATAARLRVPNYRLGDLGELDASGNPLLVFDGVVDPVKDLPLLSLVYGATSSDPQYLPTADIGPTADGTPLSQPLTDDVIDFEDLMVFAQDFPSAGAKPLQIALGSDAGDGGLRLISRERELEREGNAPREVELTLSLQGNADLLKGLALELAYDSERLRFVGTQRSAALARAGGAVLPFTRTDESSVSIDLVVLGAGAVFEGDGDLVTLRFELLSELGGTIEALSLRARSAYGEPLAIDGSALGKEQLAALPQVVALLPNAPNPFNPRTTIRFEMPARGKAALRVYDLSGRLVKTLVSGEIPAGYHSAVWEGDDDRGRNVASGVYLYELRAEGQRLVKKMLLVK